MFPDDLAVNISSQNIITNATYCSKLSDTVCNWCASNSLLINHAKTIDFQLIFNHNYVNPVNAVKFLGIVVSLIME